ncbi:YhcN/YlaJ family sporulation lipoprotein [Risungbinella massiliensis]|uniref:YhcN/YlaJ family sporulation lipoprotein n=1 Tax=Risungbinella massiliensis TaxID=1329796 RepID=UPI0005CC6BF1|nr:YhcN/YlaJ family sporulation lipoprotein [Risungbinella massiliensis]
MKGKKWLVPFGVVSILTIGTLGCAVDNNNNETGMGQNNRYPETTRVRNVTPVPPTDPDPTTPMDRNDDGQINNGGIDNDRTNNDRIMNYRASDRAAEALTKMKGVKSATVFIYRETAYVGATVDPAQSKTRSMDRKMKQSMLQQVKKVEPDVKSVYVSTAPSFVTELEKVNNDIRAGRPITNLDERIQNLISSTFPGNP